LLGKHASQKVLHLGHIDRARFCPGVIGYFERRVIGVLVIRYLIRDGRGAGQQAVKPRAKNDVGYGPGSPTIAVCKRVNPVQAPKNVCA